MSANKLKSGIMGARMEPLEERRMMSGVNAAHGDPGYDRSAYEFELGKAGASFAGVSATLFGADASARFAAAEALSAGMLESGFDAQVIEEEIASGTYSPRLKLWGHARGSDAAQGAAQISPFGAVAIRDYADHPPQSRRNSPPPVRHHALIVEDDAGSRMALTKILQRRGWDVTAVGTLAEGMRELQDTPEVVILDLTLPDGEGETLLRQIRGQHLQTCVAVTTGADDRGRLQHIQQLGADAVLSKPLNVAALLQRLPHLPDTAQGALAA